MATVEVLTMVIMAIPIEVDAPIMLDLVRDLIIVDLGSHFSYVDVRVTLCTNVFIDLMYISPALSVHHLPVTRTIPTHHRQTIQK